MMMCNGLLSVSPITAEITVPIPGKIMLTMKRINPVVESPTFGTSIVFVVC